MNKNFFFSVILVMVLVFGMTVVGCDFGDNNEIDSKFIGKWEVQSFVYQGTTYILPNTLLGRPIESAGYEITATSIKTYGNGVVIQKVDGIYSDGNSFYNSAGLSVLTMWVGENDATIKTLEETDFCTKKTKFSWE